MRRLVSLSLASLVLAGACKGPDASAPPGAAKASLTATPLLGNSVEAPRPPAPLAVPAQVVPAPVVPAPVVAAAVVAAPVVAALPTPKAPPPGALIGEKVPFFMAQVDTFVGDKVQPSKLDSQKAGAIVVYTILGTGCPASRAYVERANALEREYASRGVKFVYLYPNVDEQAEQKRAFHKQNGYPGGMVDDKGGKLAKVLGTQRSSEMVIVDKSGKIAFRGPVDDARNPLQVKQRYVAPALDELLAGKPVTVAYADVFA